MVEVVTAWMDESDTESGDDTTDSAEDWQEVKDQEAHPELPGYEN